MVEEDMTGQSRQKHFREDDERTISYFSDRLDEFGEDPRALDWSGAEAQLLRFGVIGDIGIAEEHSVLDVGCGQGDFFEWLRRRGLQENYTGADISEDMLAIAGKRWPEASFHRASALEVTTLGKFDWVIASGIFYLRVHEPYGYLEQAVSEMYACAHQGVCFNTLADWGGRSGDDNEFRAIPSKVLEICHAICPRVVLRADYHPGDITVCLYKHPERT